MKTNLSFNNTIFLLFILNIIIFFVSCKNSESEGGVFNINDTTIIYTHSEEYNNKIKEFKYSPTDAIELLVQFIRKQKGLTDSDKVPIGFHWFIVGNSYVYSKPDKLVQVNGIILTGYYIDGNSGKVEYKIDKRKVPYRVFNK